MKRTLLVMVLVAALTFAFAASAFADHSPDFYVAWTSGAYNTGTGSPHGNYSLNTVKCAVCHAVHRAASAGMAGKDAAWGNPTGTTPVPATGPTQLMLRSDVADACNYCHINTGIGGVRLYNGNVGNIGNWVNSGYGHGNGCTDCHAVHGADTFKGAMITKDLRWDQYKGTNSVGAANVMLVGDPTLGVNAAGPEHNFVNPDTGNTQASTMQDEIFIAGASSGYVTPNSGRVDPSNIPMFDGNGTPLDVVMGTNLNTAAGYTNAHEAQGSAFCTQCHQNFSASSDTTINVDNEYALFGGWANLTSGAWLTATGGTFTFKNHPMKPNSGAAWSGHGATFSGQVAWMDSTYCRSCHDAGEVNANQNHPAGYVVENSYPHATPGYLDFMTASTSADVSGAYPLPLVNSTAGAAGNKDSYADGADLTNLTPNGWPTRYTITQPADPAGIQNYGSWTASSGKVWNDGSCLKCHRSGTSGVGFTF